MKRLVKEEISETINDLTVTVHKQNEEPTSIHVYRNGGYTLSIIVFDAPAKEVAATFRKVAEFLETV